MLILEATEGLVAPDRNRHETGHQGVLDEILVVVVSTLSMFVEPQVGQAGEVVIMAQSSQV